MIIGTLNQQGSKRKTTLFVVGRHLIESEFFGEVDIKIEDPEPPFHDHILRAAQTYQVDATLIRAIIMAESNYDPKAVTHRGAQGLMQLMPTTARWLRVQDSFDPAQNIDAGVRCFKDLLDRFDGEVQQALASIQRRRPICTQVWWRTAVWNYFFLFFCHGIRLLRRV